jgi:hypothetical protein
MSARSYAELRYHIGHEIECVGYGRPEDPAPVNVALECVTCGVVLLDFDADSEEDE